MNIWHSGQPVRYETIQLPADGDQGWTTVESVLVRFNTSLTPSGRFPVFSDQPLPNYDGPQKRIGYDVAVCVQKYEPWVIEAYNASTGSPSALRIVGKGNGSSTSLSPSGTILGSPIANTRYLHATGKDAVFTKAHVNSVTRMLRINLEVGVGYDNYVPPTLVGPVMPLCTTFLLTPPSPQAFYFTDGAGLREYTELSPSRYATIRARVGAATALPYLVGSGLVVAQSYEDETLAYTTFKPWQLITLLLIVLNLGIIGELFVPILPLGVPRREFGPYSWLALFQSQARGIGRIPCTKTDRTLTSRSCNLRRLTNSRSS